MYLFVSLKFVIYQYSYFPLRNPLFSLWRSFLAHIVWHSWKLVVGVSPCDAQVRHSQQRVSLSQEDAKNVVCVKLPVRSKKYSIWKNDGMDGFIVSLFVELHTRKLQAILISVICLCTLLEPDSTWCQPKAVWVTPPRILHPGKDLTSFVALQNWKIIVISELCCYQIL